MSAEEVEERSEDEVELQMSGPMTLETALKRQLHLSLTVEGLSRGLREVIKAIESQSAKVCILAKDCQNKEYKELVTALCKQRNINLIHVEQRKELGLWCGLGKIEEDGKIGKVVGCSSCTINDWGGQTEAKKFIEESFM